ncbi:sigma-70 family RNA polymerase sigma factor [Rubritalea tangerina]|uniref:Sigma-70 family RNA polymerase sigma factor n=1 Tax=Rubritalea tangerina TaxID=430798 RepID=A0ABW4Z9H6_9BACT
MLMIPNFGSLSNVMNPTPTDTHEFVKLLTGHQASLRAFIVALMPGSPDVQDVLQDTNVILWEKMADYTPGTSFKNWSFTIARFMVKAQYRSNKRYLSPMLNEDIIHAISERWYNRQPEATQLRQAALEKCVKGLKTSEQDIIEACYSHGSNLEKYSTIIGRSANSLRVSLFRIRNKLKDCVEIRIAQEGGKA